MSCLICLLEQKVFAYRAGVFGVAITYGYFVFGTIVNRLLMGPLAQWSARVEKAEGDFR